MLPTESFSFTYDDNGNRLTRTIDSTTETYDYVSATNHLDSVTETDTVYYSYDSAGKITGIDDRTLVYNDNDRLIRVEEDGTVLGEYVYNGLGQRMKKTVDGVDTVYHWDLNDNIIAESDASGTFAKEYLYRHSGRLAMVDVASGTFYYYLNDNLGTPQMLTDAAGMVVWEGIYRPFGETTVNANSTVENNFRFAGQYFDAETGWHYNYHRYYDPSSGRYLRPDPIGLGGGINLYSYAKNNPIQMFDPYGLRNVYVSGIFTSLFVDINSPKITLSFPFFDGDQFGVDFDGKPSFGISSALVGYSVNIATDTPFSPCQKSGNPNLDSSFFYAGGIRHNSYFTNMSCTIVGVSRGMGISIPYVNASTSMETAITTLSENIVGPTIQGLTENVISPAMNILADAINKITN